MTAAELSPNATAEQLAELEAAARNLEDVKRAVAEGRADLGALFRAQGRWNLADEAAQ